MEIFTEGSDLSLVLQYRQAPEDTETSNRNRNIVLHALDMLAAGDPEAIWDMFSPDVVFHEAACLPYGGAHHGIEATRKAFETMCDTFAENRVIFEQVLAAGDMVIAYQTIDFRVKKTGITGKIPVSEMFRFEDGKVIEWRACYFDANLVAAAIDPENYHSPAR